MPVRVKICGITRIEDALEAVRLGADAIGLNFFPGSPRCITAETARLILRELPAFVEPVAVVVNESAERIRALADSLGFRTLQWHGDGLPPTEDLEIRLIPAFRVQDASSLATIDHYLASLRGWRPAAILVDAHVPGQYGGTGQSPPWPLLAEYRPLAPLVLAGGLTADNVAEGVRVVRPWAVDTASGVESSPGIKDREKMRRFIENAREAAG